MIQESAQPLMDEKEVHAWAEVSPKALRAQSEPEVTSEDVVLAKMNRCCRKQFNECDHLKCS